MSAVKKLISQLEFEDEIIRKESKKKSEEQDKELNKLRSELDCFKEEMTKCINDTKKELEQLLANQSTIEKILEQTNDFNGLPIPYEHHKAAVEVVSKVTEFINNSNHFNTSNVNSPNEIHENLINVTENIALDLKDCHTEVSEAQSLYFNTKLLKNIANNSTDNVDRKLISNCGTILD